MPEESRKVRTLPWISLVSKSVQISPMGAWASIMNLFNAEIRDELRFLRPYVRFSLEWESTRRRQYLMPPMAVVGPKPMSMCHLALYSVARGSGSVFRFLDFMVAAEAKLLSGVDLCLI